MDLPVIWFVQGVAFLARHLPMSFNYRVADLITTLVFFVWREKRNNAFDNMRHVLGPQASERTVRRIAHRSFRNFMRNLVDFLVIHNWDEERLEGLLAHSFGWEHLEEALRHGKGVILVSPHFGHWEYAATMLTLRSYRVVSVGDVLKPRRLGRWLLQTRALRGVRVIPMGGSLKMLYKTLQRNEVIALVMDRPSGDNGVEVTFFGEKASLPAGPAAMSLRTGAKIIPGYCIVQPDRTVVGGMLPPIDYQPTGDRERDVQAITQMLATAMEECIRQYPDQWYMFRQMWPNGTSEKAHKC